MPASGSVTASTSRSSQAPEQPYVQCPLPGQPGAPSFGGKDITAFLQNWEQFAENYRLSPERKITDLGDYCEPGPAKVVRTLIEIAEEDAEMGRDDSDKLKRQWEVFRHLALQKYKKDDEEQHRISVPCLRALVKVEMY